MGVWVWVIPLLLLAAWLGARSLNADIVWIDELHSIEDSGGAFYGPLSPVGIWNRVAEGNPWHAPGYFMALNTWGRLVGWNPPMLRVLSLLFGLLTIAYTYRLGHELISPRTGLYAAIVLGTSAFYVHYLHEMRVYTLFTLLTAFTIWAYLRIIRMKREPDWKAWLALLGGATAMLYSHYFTAMPLAAIGLYHLLFVRKDRRWWKVVRVMALAGVLFLPWVRALLAGLALAEGDDALHERALTIGDALVKVATLFSNGVLPLFVVIGALGLTTVRRRGVMQIAFLTVVVLALLLVANEVLKIMHGGRLRYLIALWVLLSLLVGVGFARLHRWQPMVAGVTLALWAGLGVWNVLAADFTAGLDGSAYNFPMHVAVKQVDGHIQAGDVMVNYLPDDGLPTARYERIASFYYAPINLEYLMVQAPNADQQRGFVSLLESRPRVWVASMPDAPPATLDAFESALAQTFQRCDVTLSQPTLRLDLFARSPDLCAA
jgi:hypothetical protein